MTSLSQRLLPVLQLTRMALVFTALADSGCELLLLAARQGQQNGQSLWHQLQSTQCIALAVISVGLYGFGMSLNDIIDQRRDRQISPGRPLPSGRIGVGTAHVVCALLILWALAAGEIYSDVVANAQLSLILVFFTAGLITFYDFAGKYLVPLGLLSLGLIRFFHATIAAPSLPVLWHPLLLMNHVTIISTVAYHWEQKRPALRPAHWWSVILGLMGLNLLAVTLVWWRRSGVAGQSLATILTLSPALLGPVAAVVVFFFLAVSIRRRSANPRDAGQTLMLSGLLWLIVYDAIFVIAFAGVLAGLLLLLLLPVAYVSVVIMRGWGKIILLSQRPTFKRIET